MRLLSKEEAIELTRKDLAKARGRQYDITLELLRMLENNEVEAALDDKGRLTYRLLRH